MPSLVSGEPERASEWQPGKLLQRITLAFGRLNPIIMDHYVKCVRADTEGMLGKIGDKTTEVPVNRSMRCKHRLMLLLSRSP